MPSNPKQPSLVEILNHLDFQLYELRASKRLEGPPFARENKKFHQEAQAQIEQAINKIIGSDADEHHSPLAAFLDTKPYYQNKLRAEQRAALKRFIYGDSNDNQ